MPLPPEKPASSRSEKERLPYTSIGNSALEMGLTMADLDEISWGELVLMLQARARSYADPSPKVREATQAEIDNWF